MPNEEKEFTYRHTRIRPCTFSLQQNRSQNLLQSLRRGVLAWVKETPIILSLSPDTLEKAQELIAFLRTLPQSNNKKRPLRFSFNQIDSTSLEWDSIVKEHQVLMHLGEEKIGEEASLIHLSTPCEPLFAEAPPIRPVMRVEEMLEKLPKLNNGEGWSDLCAWYQKLLKEIFLHLPRDAVDVYTLERYLKDFEHEVHSSLLQRGRRHLFMLQLSLGLPENPVQKGYHERLSIEKEIIFLRQDLMQQVGDHYRSLKEMMQLIPIVQEAHPELERVKNAGLLLKSLLANQVEETGITAPKWGVMQMQLQLLEGELGAVSLIHQADDFRRPLLALAIRSSILQIKEDFSNEVAIDLALHWEETARHVNLLAAKKGEPALLTLGEREKKVILFRERAYGFLQKCVLPLTASLFSSRDQSSSLAWIHPEILNYIPSFAEGKLLVEYDLSTGEPKEATAVGRNFLQSIFN